MDSDTPDQVRVWSFSSAPAEFRALFPASQKGDWIVHVGDPQLQVVAEHLLLRWRPIFPVEVVELREGGVAYWGAESRGLASMVESRAPAKVVSPVRLERRRAPRVAFETA